MSRAELERLEDIVDAITAIHEHLVIVDEHGRHGSDLVRDALLYNLVIIGEAVKHVGLETRARRPDIQRLSVKERSAARRRGASRPASCAGRRPGSSGAPRTAGRGRGT